MKPTLLFATLSMVFASPQTFAATELETLRARCTQQERQIRHLEEQVQKLQSGGSVQSPPVTHASAAPATAAVPATHTVRAGESLERIARRNGCTVAKLAKTNGLKSSAIIHPGQKLKLPGATSAAPAPALATAQSKAVDSVSPLAGKTHKIQAGETYASISRKHRTSIASLVAANPNVKPTALRPGQVIRLSAETPVSTPLALSKPAAHAASTPVASPSPRPPTGLTPIHKTTPVIASKPAAAPAPPVSTPVAAARIESPIPAPAAPKETAAAEPAQPAETAAASAPQQQPSSPSNPEKKIRSVTIEGEMTYGEFAATHGTDTNRLNDLNGLDLNNATVLAKGSELYVPAQP